ncbi:hypothetical protein LPJ72_001665 [Coemansia sp. Benny D160-2]|nr:hypothetical protein LPJ72_001665 [Coemansia sp. Benny D160-2]
MGEMGSRGIGRTDGTNDRRFEPVDDDRRVPSPPVDEYGGRLDSLRRTEYPQLFEPTAVPNGLSEPVQLKTVFLDHAGSTLYAASHIRAHAEQMLSHIPANPHSRHAASQWTQAKIDHARDRLLAFFGTSARNYAVVFTANATAAIRIAGELTPVDPKGGVFCYTQESHTSVVGLRNMAAERGASVRPARFSEIREITAPQNTRACSLLAYPAQCNFSGERFPLDVADRIHDIYSKTPDHTEETHIPWWVLVDAAAYAATSPLALDTLDGGPDFVAVSMYKIFGAPTGLGALLIKRASVPFLSTSRRYFGGGTVAGLVYDRQWQSFRHDIESRMEDGTVNFQDIVSLHHALDAHASNYGSINRVSVHVNSVTRYAEHTVGALRHSNGLPLCRVYGHTEGSDYGPTLAFNVQDAQGRCVGYVEVERLAVIAGIALRAGRFCNPGASQKWLGLDADKIIEYTSLGFICGDDHDLVNGMPLGALRISFGAMTSKTDIDLFCSFLARHFKDYLLFASMCTASTDKKTSVGVAPEFTGHGYELTSKCSSQTLAASPPQIFSRPGSGDATVQDTLRVEIDQVVIYPVKSCHGWVVPKEMDWAVTRFGLRFDRSFIVMRENSTIPMQQKRYPNMALIQTRIDVERLVLVLEFPDLQPLEVSLLPENLALQGIESRVCGDAMKVSRILSDEISAWLSSALSVSCYLACDPRLLWASADPENDELTDSSSDTMPFSGSDNDGVEKGISSCTRRGNISFANESQILLVTQESAQQVEEWVAEESLSAENPHSETTSTGPMQYRPNIIVKSATNGPAGRALEPFEELQWTYMEFGLQRVFKVSGPCRRCQMISIDQNSAKTLKAPYSTLARRMRVGGKVVFGIYLDSTIDDDEREIVTVRSGMLLRASM